MGLDLRSVFDTNILIDYLWGRKQAVEIIKNAEKPIISIVTFIEVMAGVKKDKEKSVRKFLESFESVDVTSEIAEIAIKIRRQTRLKLPDAIIWATAKTREVILITRDDGFPREIDISTPYRLH